ncbi:MAG: hypothetical protein HY721_08130 [Planctomycetes bacterium]|nr:hypothetical protein [Planctomycetota bacterium]
MHRRVTERTLSVATQLLLPALLSVLGPALRAQEAAKTEVKATFLNALPKDTTLLLHASSVKGTLDRIKASPLHALRDHPDVKRLTARIEEEAKGGLAGAKAELGFDPFDLLLSLDGEWVIAVGNLDSLASAIGEGLSIGQPPDVKPEQVPLLVAADAGSAAPRVRELFEKLFAYAEKQGAVKETKDFQGGRITSIRERPAKAPAGKGSAGEKPGEKGSGQGPEKEKEKGKPEGGAQGSKGEGGGSDLAAPDEQDAAKGGEDEQGKKGAGDDDSEGAGDEGSQEGRGRPDVVVHFGELGGRFYFSLSRAFLEACMGKVDAPGASSLLASPTFQETQKLIGSGDVLAYLNVKGLTGSISSALSTTFFAFFWQKFDALFFGKSFNGAAVALSVEDRGLRETFFLHNSGGSDGILSVFKADAFTTAPPALVPANAKTFSGVALNPENLGKIVKDIAQTAMAFRGPATDVDLFFEQLSGAKLSEIVGGLGRRAYTFSGTVNADNPFSSLGFALELRDEAPILKVLKKLSAGPQGALEASKVKDRDVYVLGFGSFDIAFAVVDKQLLAGSKEEVDKVIGRTAEKGSGLAESEDFKRVAASLPAQAAMVGYSTPDYIRANFSALAEAARGTGEEDAEVLVGAILAVADVLGTSYSYGVWKDAGFYGDGWLLYRKP